jgi:pectin methylesterase-like acyl-CoA thioesterase
VYLQSYIQGAVDFIFGQHSSCELLALLRI